jgi:hypothetical protein
VGVLGIDEKADRQLADVYVFGCHRASIAEETSRIGMLQLSRGSRYELWADPGRVDGLQSHGRRGEARAPTPTTQ